MRFGSLWPQNLAATAAPDAEIQQRARQLFVEYGYLDELIHDLRNAQAGERVAAARILGEFGSDLATPALVEVLLDSEPEVRSAAAAALMQIGEPSTAFERTPLQQPPRGSAPLLFPDQVKSDPPTSESLRHAASEQSAVLYSASDQSDGADLQSLFLKENALGKSLEEMENRLLKVTGALTEANKEIQLRAEAALKFKSEATTLRQREEECRKQAEEATSLHETEIELKAQAEQARQTLTEEVTLKKKPCSCWSNKVVRRRKRRAWRKLSDCIGRRKSITEPNKIRVLIKEVIPVALACNGRQAKALPGQRTPKRGCGTSNG